MPHPARAKTKGWCSSAARLAVHALLFASLAPAPSTALASTAVPGSASEQLVVPLLPSGPRLSPEPPVPAEHVFTLRHIYHHGTHRYPSLHRRQDIHTNDADIYLAAGDGYDRHRIPTLHARSHGAPIERLVDRRPSVVDPMVALARERGYVTALSPDAWTVDEVPSPNISDKATVLSLAYMAADAYVASPELPDWQDVGAPLNRSLDFGWEGDGLRGHVFADTGNRTVVIGLKGTSLAVFDGEGTTTNDKENDNLFFACCCGQQGQWTYRQVCSCATGTYACNNTCVREALHDENRYYMAARELYTNVSAIYPDATIWFAGHSLGGSVSSFIGLTYGLPVVTFQAVPEALAAGRLGLPVPPGADPNFPQARALTGTAHFGHTADPIFMGICNGATASCSYAGYALETACHTGVECIYDVVQDKGWRVGVGTHRIVTVIRDVLLPYDDVPVCNATPECRDCANWRMYESNATEPTTTSTTSSATKTHTPTRTQTCQTPGWWGCLDETTTATATSTTTTTAVVTTTTTSTSTTTCKTPGRFWGCKDEPTTTTAVPDHTTTRPRTTTPTATLTSTATSTSCATPGYFWGCKDMTTTPAAPSHSTTVPSETQPVGKPRCRHRSWFGFCKDWGDSLEL